MSDLIERLRTLANLRIRAPLHASSDTEGVWLNDAADEIERLTAERDELLEALHQLIAVIGLTAIKYKSDLDILQAAVDEASAAIAKAEGRQRC